MSFVPEIRDAQTPMGLITVTTAGTSVPLDTNWDPKYDASLVTPSNKPQYAYAADDIVFSFPPGNAGGIYLVKRGGSKDSPETVIAYFPKIAGVPQLPQKLSSYFQGRFAPYALALDSDMDGDGAWGVGLNG